MNTFRRNSAEPGQSSSDSGQIIEEINKEKGVIRRFSKGRFLGKGGFAKCYEFTNLETKKVIAAKIIPKSSLTKSKARSKLMSEIKIHKSVKHTNIVGFEHFFEDHENVYILLEMCTNQTMNELIKRRRRLSELEVMCYLLQILSAMKYLQTNRVIHRDLKLGNLFLSDQMQIKLGDFGLASKLDYQGERKHTICGTPNYIAPEIIEAKSYGHSYEVDVWSLGVIAYTLIVGKPPFETTDVKSTYNKIKMNDYSFPDSVQVSSAAKNLIRKIILTDPSKRLTVDEIINHEFFKTYPSIPKLLPVSTLACPPSSSYSSQFMHPLTPSSHIPSTSSSTPVTSSLMPSTSSLIASTASSHYLAQGRSGSPAKRFEYTAPQVNSAYYGGSKSHSQITVKDRKETSSTYRTGGIGGNNSNSGLCGSSYGIKNFDSQQIKVSENHQKAEEQVKLVDDIKTYSKDIGNNIISKQPTSTTTATTAISNNNYFQRARSEKMNTQPAQPIVNTPSSILALNRSGGYPQQQINQFVAPNESLQGPNIWVQKWVDYSAKYGLGYVLSNGAFGVFFNDQTKIISENESKFKYIEKRQIDKKEITTEHNINSYPELLQKKVTLLSHFKSYLQGNDKQVKSSVQTQQQPETQQLQNNNGIEEIYVKKWLKTKHAVLFKLNNKVVQVIFQDQTEILLTSEQKVVTYINKLHQRVHFPFQTTMEYPNQEMSKRLKYTKDILQRMLMVPTQQTEQQQINQNGGGSQVVLSNYGGTSQVTGIQSLLNGISQKSNVNLKSGALSQGKIEFGEQVQLKNKDGYESRENLHNQKSLGSLSSYNNANNQQGSQQPIAFMNNNYTARNILGEIQPKLVKENNFGLKDQPKYSKEPRVSIDI